MKKIHVECLPDETLVKKLGFSSKQVFHHQGKSRVFHRLKTSQNEIGLVDEDPGSPKSTYEKNLILIKEVEGIKHYRDANNNQVFMLKGKLEDWILIACSKDKVDVGVDGLPARPNELHSVINNRIANFERLISRLKKGNNSSLNQLNKLLHQ